MSAIELLDGGQGLAKKKLAKPKKQEKAKAPAPDPIELAAGEGLTVKRELFCQEYILDLNAKRAYQRVYECDDKTAETNGPRLLRFAQVEKRIQALMNDRMERTQITADYVLGTIKDTVERCRQARPVLDMFGQPVMIESPDGDIVPAYTFMPKEVLKGCELLAKHQNLLTDRKEFKGILKLEDLLNASHDEEEET
jgi:phage terminase small subunit